MTPTRRAIAAVLATSALVPITASASTSDDGRVTWEQARVALAASRALPAPRAGAGGGTASVTIPDLAWALDDPSAPEGVRRAACHQVTGLDDETAALLAACLVHVRAEERG